MTVHLSKIKFPNEKTLKLNWFKPQYTVKQLYLDGFYLEGIEKDAFYCQSFGNLHTLQLSNMRILRVFGDMFRGLENLKSLIIIESHLSRFDDDALKEMSNLEAIMIDKCHPNLTIGNSFKSSSLTRVYIRNCVLLDRINRSTFSGLHNVEKIHLSNDRIDQNEIVIRSKTLKSIDLSNNKLTTFPQGLYNERQLAYLTVNLNGNPWHCNCTLKKMWEIARNESQVTFTEIICASPTEYKSKALTEIQLDCKEMEERNGKIFLHTSPQKDVKKVGKDEGRYNVRVKDDKDIPKKDKDVPKNGSNEGAKELASDHGQETNKTEKNAESKGTANNTVKEDSVNGESEAEVTAKTETTTGVNEEETEYVDDDTVTNAPTKSASNEVRSHLLDKMLSIYVFIFLYAFIQMTLLFH